MLTTDTELSAIAAPARFGQTRQPIASTASQIELRRTAEGFRGESHAQQEVIPGTLSCPVVFPYEITACSAEGLTLRGLPAVDVKVERAPLADGGFTLTCGASGPPTSGFTENVLVRDGSDAGPDGGPTVDAGSPLDSGSTADAGSTPDAGSAADAGAALDGGPPPPGGARDAGADAGIVEA